jgi:cell division protein FtsW (lipid II flippase)
MAAGAVLVVLLVALLGTMSRTSVYTCACLVAVGLLVRYQRNVGPVALGLLLSVGVVAMVLDQYRAVSEDRAEAFMDRVIRRDTESYQHSQAGRIRDTLRPLNEALDQPAIFVVGRGPAKSEMRTDAHGDVGWYFHRFGLPGLLFYLLLLYWGLRLAYHRFVRATDSVERSIALTGVLAIVTWAMFALVEDVWKDPQTMTVTMFLYGLLHARPAAMRIVAEGRAIRGRRRPAGPRPAAALRRPRSIAPCRGARGS